MTREATCLTLFGNASEAVRSLRLHRYMYVQYVYIYVHIFT